MVDTSIPQFVGEPCLNQYCRDHKKYFFIVDYLIFHYTVTKETLPDTLFLGVCIWQDMHKKV